MPSYLEKNKKKPKKEKDVSSKYVKYVNYWNSEDHPNCINLFVTATPWNLNTNKSKFNKSTIIAYNKSTKKMEFIDQQTVSSMYTKKSSLHDIRLSNLEYKERKVRLMVSSPFSPLKASKFIAK